MKTSIKLIVLFAGLFILASTLLYFSNESAIAAKEDALRQKKNVEVLSKNFKCYKDAYGKSVAKVQSLNYKVSELKKNDSVLMKTISDLKIKPKDVKSIAQVGTETKKEIEIKIKYVDSTKCLFFEDKYNTISGCFKGDSIPLTVITRDSLSIIASRVPAHRFLWWKWGTKGVELSIKAENPGTKFTYLKYIELN